MTAVVGREIAETRLARFQTMEISFIMTRWLVSDGDGVTIGEARRCVCRRYGGLIVGPRAEGGGREGEKRWYKGLAGGETEGRASLASIIVPERVC